MRLWRAVALVAAVGAAAAAAGIGVRASYGARVTGDEPHYLLTAISLGEDFDLDVADEIASGRFRAFHELGIDPQARPLAGGRLVEPHDPLLPALLAVPVRLGGWLGAKIVLALLNGVLAGLMLWTAVRRFGVAVTPAALASGLYAASAPLAVYGNQIYPELPAAVAVAAAVAALTGALRWGGLALVAICVIALPWLSVKYAPVAAALAAIALARTARGRGFGTAAAAAAVLGAAGVAFVVAHQVWYGGWTPYATGDHFVAGEFGVVGFDPNYAGRSTRLIGLLVDRYFGLAAWQPAWLLVIPALAGFARARPPGWSALVLPVALGWLTATFVALTMHGWWWPGRQVVVIAPLAVVAVAWWASTRRRVAMLTATGLLGLAFYGRVVFEGLAGQITWVVDFFDTGDPVQHVWRSVLPDYVAGGRASTWVLHALWATVLAGLAAVGWRAATNGSAGTAAPERDPAAAAGQKATT